MRQPLPGLDRLSNLVELVEQDAALHMATA
jgi:hypothetical protein